MPFDNLRKLLALRAGTANPLPGDDARDFFEAWLRDGTGGTCWAGAGALHALLKSLEFQTTRVIGTMASRPNAASNHGTVIVTLDATQYFVDSAILHDAPLPVAPNPIGWTTHWRPLDHPNGIDCRIEEVGVPAERFRSAHEATRSYSPFNAAPYVRITRDGRVIGLVQGVRIELADDGTLLRNTLDSAAARRFLIDEVGIRDVVAQCFFTP